MSGLSRSAAISPVRAALHELTDPDTLAVTGGANGKAEGGRGLAFALTGVDVDVAATARAVGVRLNTPGRMVKF